MYNSNEQKFKFADKKEVKNDRRQKVYSDGKKNGK